MSGRYVWNIKKLRAVTGCTNAELKRRGYDVSGYYERVADYYRDYYENQRYFNRSGYSYRKRRRY